MPLEGHLGEPVPEILASVVALRILLAMVEVVPQTHPGASAVQIPQEAEVFRTDAADAAGIQLGAEA